MSTLRISNIEAKSVPASATIDEKVKITNSSGDVLVFLDGKTSGITTVGINTTDGNITFDANSNVVVTGIITATRFSGEITPTNLNVVGTTTTGQLNVTGVSTFGGELISNNGTLRRNVSDSSFTVSGDTASNTGANINLYGASHGSLANVFRVRTGSTERLRIDSNGRAMIGTVTPSSNTAAQVLTIADTTASAASGNCGITIRSGTGGGSNTNEGSIFFSDATSGAGEYAGFVQYSHANNWLRFGTASTPRVYIDSSGRMLIGGTTTEGYADADDLTLATAGNTGMTIRAGASNYGSIFFSDATSGTGEYDGFLQYGHSSQSLAIGAASATKMTIYANGHVVTRGNNNGNAVGMELRNENTAAYSHAELALTSQNATTSKIWCDVPNARMRFQYNGGTTVGVDQSGNVQLANGSGISFSASSNFGTMNSEILDDYEEGYWTPTIGGHISDGSSSYGNQKGAYVRIGALVYLSWYISWTSTNASGQFRIYGQPYAAATTYGTNYNITTGSMMFDNITTPYANGQMVPYLSNGANQIVFYGSYYTSGWDIMSHDSTTTNGGSMIASITYRAA